MIGLIILLYLILLAGLIVLAVLYLSSLSKALKECDPRNRQVSPDNVWLMFIPLFNIIYPFILYPKISDSLSREFRYRGINTKGDCSRGLGISIPILGLCGIIPVLGAFAGLANLILWIVWWVKINEYKNELIRLPKGGKDGLINISSNPDLLD